MGKKIIIGTIIGLVVLLSAAGFIYAHQKEKLNNDSRKPTIMEENRYSEMLSNRRQQQKFNYEDNDYYRYNWRNRNKNLTNGAYRNGKRSF